MGWGRNLSIGVVRVEFLIGEYRERGKSDFHIFAPRTDLRAFRMAISDAPRTATLCYMGAAESFVSGRPFRFALPPVGPRRIPYGPTGPL